ncbi:hypothetical protein RHSIM_Rhsim04G0041000 [Rhododendron simsii]|uniref:Uncharacterized protein n=1 Tax=Rhododendron simsii TaxID=118357 RepID=A0A834LM03_RHOSS|nr:hypothetical protein RHSIM_Rhsim04G0041000 [Rhododendron simsii]
MEEGMAKPSSMPEFSKYKEMRVKCERESHNEKKQNNGAQHHILYPKYHSCGYSEQTTHLHDLQLQVLGPSAKNDYLSLIFEPFGVQCFATIARFFWMERISCNGLICSYWPKTYNPYVICNPVINGDAIVPQMDKGYFDQCSSGFGFCSGTNQHESWSLHWYPGGCFLNGALHWIVYDIESCFKSTCCFNFGKERFQPFSAPSQLSGVFGQPGVLLERIKIGMLKDGLSVFHRPTNYMLDKWVMKDYPAQESLTKDFVIKIPGPYNNLLCQPLMVLNNWYILMLYALTTLLSWNTRDRSIRKVRVNGILSVIRATTYISSFVSIKNVAAGTYS